jgi:membrane fusion protein (multidrug efflux system)
MSDLATKPTKPEPAVVERKTPPRRGRRKLAPILLAIVILVVVVGAGYYVWRYLNTYESTDDAQIDGHINPISARITGHVIEVLTEEERYVNKGDVIVRIDPKDYEVAVAKAEADVASAEATLSSSHTTIPVTDIDTSSQLVTAESVRAEYDAAVVGAQRQLDAAAARLQTARAQVREAEANEQKARDDRTRYQLLVVKDEISKQTYQTAVSAEAAAQATTEARRAAVVEAEENIRVAQSAVTQAKTKIVQADASIRSARTAPRQVAISEARAKSSQAQVAQTRALLEQAKLNLEYCTIVAPVTGIVGKKTVEVGQNVSPGQQLMAVVPLDDIWVTANFKETQLERMKAGQKVRFSVDAYGREYSGRVEAIGGASGSRFSLLPPENATGNYVKVVQRIPVRIDLDPGQNGDRRLRPGMSVDPKVFLIE